MAPKSAAGNAQSADGKAKSAKRQRGSVAEPAAESNKRGRYQALASPSGDASFLQAVDEELAGAIPTPMGRAEIQHVGAALGMEAPRASDDAKVTPDADADLFGSPKVLPPADDAAATEGVATAEAAAPAVGQVPSEVPPGETAAPAADASVAPAASAPPVTRRNPVNEGDVPKDSALVTMLSSVAELCHKCGKEAVSKELKLTMYRNVLSNVFIG